MPQIDGTMDELYSVSFHSDIGWFRPVSDGSNLIRLDWNQTGWTDHNHPDHVSRETKSQLEAYLRTKLQHFTVPLAPYGKSSQGAYWLEIMSKIPYGTVISYKEFANLAGKPNASQAAGSSCATNPIPIIYPCHRVVRNDGNIGNYGGGSPHDSKHQDNLSRKAALIAFEKNSLENLT